MTIRTLETLHACILRERKYLKSDDEEKVKADQSNIYGYEKGALSRNLFYGARNISQAKVGNVIYVPEITQTGETLHACMRFRTKLKR